MTQDVEAPPAPELSDDELPGALEAILLVVDEPIAVAALAEVVQRPVAQVQASLAELVSSYDDGIRGLELREGPDGWRLWTHPRYAHWVERYVRDGQQARLTQAALETLAVVAYRQPVTRSRVAAIRGVNVDAVMRTLLSRGLIAEVGTEPDTQAVRYATTPFFLDRMGLRSLEELPALADYLPDYADLDADEPGQA